jgi:hypothetical protein
MLYDYIIIGSGPSGLTCAHAISKAGYTCLVIDQELSAGGCHRVDRVNGLFSEHGPRIYSSGYLNFHSLLKEHKVKSGFKPYKFTITPSLTRKSSDNTASQALNVFSGTELLYLGGCYFHCMIDSNYYLSRSSHTVFGHFSKKSLDYIDKICRLTDGAGSKRYTAYEFFQLINQNMFYEILEPANPNDLGWVKELVSSLEKRGVNFKMDQRVTKLTKKNREYHINTDTNGYTGRNIIFATPTDTLAKFFPKFNQIDLKDYNRKSLYETYIPFTLHWNEKLNLKDIWGQGIGPWNIAWVVMSDYMNDPNTSGTLISCCISKLNTPGINGKTVNQCDLDELKKEALLQLKPLLKDKVPRNFVMSSQVYFDTVWKNRDTAYMLTPENYNIKFPFKMKGENIFSVGTHNGHSSYSFTSAESSVQNALKWANIHIKGFNKKISTGWTVNYVFLLISLIICLYYTGKNNKLTGKLSLKTLVTSIMGFKSLDIV